MHDHPERVVGVLLWGQLRVTSVRFLEADHRWGQHWPGKASEHVVHAGEVSLSQVVTEHVVHAGEVFEVVAIHDTKCK